MYQQHFLSLPPASRFHLGRGLPASQQSYTPKQEALNTNSKESVHTFPQYLFYHKQIKPSAYLQL